MKILEVIKQVENSPDYKSFAKKNPDHYLVHMFCMRDSHTEKDWQVGYYSKDSDRITVFDMVDGKIQMMPDQEVFKEKSSIPLLDLATIHIDEDAAMEKAEGVLKTHYSAESIVKAIVLLQNLPEFGQLWNITVITMTFHVINIKIGANSGEVLKHSRESLLGWKKE